MSSMGGDVNIDTSPDVLPLQADSNLPQQPIVAKTVGTISSVAGLPGPDILISAGGPTNGLSLVITPLGSTITFSISGAPTALKEASGPTTLTLGGVADGDFLKRVGTTIVGAAGGGGGTTFDAGLLVWAGL
jgi:hypothetical protein